MIVKDKTVSIEFANQIVTKMVEHLKECENSDKIEDSPSEYIYLFAHIAGNIIARMCVALEGYGKMYNIENMSTESILEWINLIAIEYIKVNKNV